MKKNFFLGACFSLMTTMALAQNSSSVGIKGGVLLSNIQVNGVMDALIPEKAFYAGYATGLYYDLPLNEQWSFVPGVSYQEKGFHLKEGWNMKVLQIPLDVQLKATTKIQFVETPLLLKYRFGEGPVQFYLAAGPSVSYASRARLETKASLILDFNISETNINLNNQNYNRWGVNGVGLAGVEIPAGKGKLLLEGQYQQLITDFIRDPIIDVHVRNYGFGFNIGYQIPLN